MPCVSRFYGIAIYLYANDHNPPHLYAKYAGGDAAIELATLTILAGDLPERALSMVEEWAAMHQAELAEAWNRLQEGQAPELIAPLP